MHSRFVNVVQKSAKSLRRLYDQRGVESREGVQVYQKLLMCELIISKLNNYLVGIGENFRGREKLKPAERTMNNNDRVQIYRTA